MAGSNNRIRNLRNRFFKSDTQASLFHYIKEKPDESIWKDMDWSFLFHPIRTANDAWRRPRAKPSLFHYIEEEPKTPFSWKEFLHDLFTGFKNPLFIPSVFSDPEGLLQEQAYGRTRKMEAGSLSVFAHILIAGIVLFALNHHGQPELQNENVVFIDNPIYVPFEARPGSAPRRATARTAAAAAETRCCPRNQAECLNRLPAIWLSPIPPTLNHCFQPTNFLHRCGLICR